MLPVTSFLPLFPTKVKFWSALMLSRFLCACVLAPPQIAPQTWIITPKRTTTATRRSRKPATTRFMARSVLRCRKNRSAWKLKLLSVFKGVNHCTKIGMSNSCMSKTFSYNLVITVYCLVSLHIFPRLKFASSAHFCRPSAHYRIFTTKTTRSESPRSPGGKWSEPPPWPE